MRSSQQRDFVFQQRQRFLSVTLFLKLDRLLELCVQRPCTQYQQESRYAPTHLSEILSPRALIVRNDILAGAARDLRLGRGTFARRAGSQRPNQDFCSANRLGLSQSV